jgi:hypothetical protein
MVCKVRVDLYSLMTMPRQDLDLTRESKFPPLILTPSMCNISAVLVVIIIAMQICITYYLNVECVKQRRIYY